MLNNFILVSAYINIEKFEKDIVRNRTLSEYLIQGQQLLDLPIHKTVFIDSSLIHEFQTNEYTTIIPITLEELDIYPYYEFITNPENGISCLSHSPQKDTPLFHLIQLAKTEFISRVARIIDSNDIIYGWLDFGVRKIFASDKEFEQSICAIPARIKELQSTGRWQEDKIKIPGCWNLNPTDNTEFEMVRWYFCGGFFLASGNVIQSFEKEVKKELESILAEQKRIIFEVNIWFRIWKRGSMDIDWYWGDHNVSMLTLGISP